jgi:hypothetical protein
VLGVRRILGALLLAVLLAAQQAALEHPLAHVGAADEQSPLCLQHDALGTVLGAIDCAPAVFTEEAPVTAAIAAVLPPARAGAPLEPSSRGPPTLL